MAARPSWTAALDDLRAFVGARVGGSEAADIVQDVVARSLATGALDRADDPIAWLRRSARNAVIDHYRTRRAHEPIVDSDQWCDPAEPAAADDTTRRLARCLPAMLDQLTPAAREALVRIDVHGQRQHHVARDAGMSVSGMKSRVQRARRELRRRLERCFEISLDRRGAVIDLRPRAPGCACDELAS